MRLLQASVLAKITVPVAVVILVGAGLSASAAAQRQDLLPDGRPGKPDIELPGDIELPLREASVSLRSTVSDWRWPGVYDSAFRIDYTVTNTGDVALSDFRVVEENANHIVHDCYNYSGHLAPGESRTCSALLYQTVNPQTVRSTVYARSEVISGWIADETSVTYTRLSVIAPPIQDQIVDVDPGGVSLQR